MHCTGRRARKTEMTEAARSAVMALSSIGLVIPNFILASLLVIGTSFTLEVLPPAGWGGARHLVLAAAD